MKKSGLFLCTVGFVVTMVFSSLAGSWGKDSNGWWYLNDDGSYPISCWQWIDGNNDGTAECYYFDAEGYLLTNTNIDDYQVDSDGAWVQDGVVQTMKVETSNESAQVDMSFYQNNIPSSKSITDQLTITKNPINVKFGNKQMEEIRSESPIFDAGTFYVLQNVTYNYLGENAYGDPGSTPLATNLVFYLNKDAKITVRDNYGKESTVTAESYYNTYSHFRPNRDYYKNDTVIMFPHGFDTNGAITKGIITEFG